MAITTIKRMFDLIGRTVTRMICYLFIFLYTLTEYAREQIHMHTAKHQVWLKIVLTPMYRFNVVFGRQLRSTLIWKHSHDNEQLQIVALVR